MNQFNRIQKGLKLHDLYPSKKGVCACGCGVELTGRQTRWASEQCNSNAYYGFAIIQGNTSVIRKTLFSLQSGVCQSCGVYSDTWEADHILPVHQGGGACEIDNFQTLCQKCHKEKHYSKHYPTYQQSPDMILADA